MFYLVWFPHEFMYSVVEGKSIEEMNPKPRDKVHIKDSIGHGKALCTLVVCFTLEGIFIPFICLT